MKQQELIVKILTTLKEIELCTGEGSVKKKANLLNDCNTLISQDDSNLLKFILSTAFNPFWVTHINKIDKTENKYFNDYDFYTLVEMLKSLKAMNNDLRYVVTAYVNSFPLEVRDILSKVLTKNLNIGISTKAINSVFSKLIPDVELMKCEKKISLVEEWFRKGEDVFAEMKYDGWRIFAEMKGTEVVSLKTYNMSELDITKMTHIVPQLELLGASWMKTVNVEHYFFDFEITGKERQTVGGEIGKLLKGTAKEGCDKNWVVNLFDCHSWDIFEDVPSKISYLNRRSILEIVFNSTSEMPNLQISERWKVNSMEELNTLFANVLEQGCEGLVVKVGSGVYELKYSNFWVKMKSEKECDLRIIGWFKGKTGTKREKTIGGFVCESEDGKLNVDPGSGFSDKLLAEIIENGVDSYIGKIVEVKYNTIISKKDSDIKSLFLPRFKRFRFDKNYADTLERILSK